MVPFPRPYTSSFIVNLTLLTDRQLVEGISYTAIPSPTTYTTVHTGHYSATHSTFPLYIHCTLWRCWLVSQRCATFITPPPTDMPPKPLQQAVLPSHTTLLDHLGSPACLLVVYLAFPFSSPSHVLVCLPHACLIATCPFGLLLHLCVAALPQPRHCPHTTRRSPPLPYSYISHTNTATTPLPYHHTFITSPLQHTTTTDILP